MNLERFEINGFGKLNNIDIRLNKGFNIFYGTNEAGKSTLMAFIKSMLYGLKVGRLQKGEVIHPVKRYKPWQGIAYGGALEYNLDNGESIRVVRNFDTNTVKIYDSFFNDICENFSSDRENGILFAERHIGLNEACFEKTVYVKQMGLRFHNETNGDLYQRLMNINTTGNEDYSIQKAQKALKDALKNYVGTNKTSTRPLDIINTRLDKLYMQRKELMAKREMSYTFQDEVYKLKELKSICEKRRKIYIKLKVAMEAKRSIEKLCADLDCIKELYKDIVYCKNELKKFDAEPNNKNKLGYIVSIEEKRHDLNLNINEYKNRKFYLFTVSSISLIIISVFLLIFIKNIGYIPYITLIIGGTSLIGTLSIVGKSKVPQANNTYRDSIKVGIEKKLQDLQSKALTKYFIQSTKESSIKETIEIIEKKVCNDEADFDLKLFDLERFCTENGMADGYIRLIESYLNPDDDNSANFDVEFQGIYDELIRIGCEIAKKEVYLKEHFEMDDLQRVEEEINELEDKSKNLKSIQKSLTIALEALEQSSLELSKDFVPTLNNHMGDMIKLFTVGRYKDLRADKDLALKVLVPETKDISDVMLLSGGTIDQIYLALRLAAIKTLDSFEEKLPVLLDEVLAFYDDIRVEETIRFLLELSKERQILLFTSRTREVDIAKNICGGAVNIQSLDR